MANISLRRNEGNASNLPSRRQTSYGVWDPFRMMESLLRWDPYQEVAPLTRQNDLFMPAFEVKETKDSYIFNADLPGVKENDIDISVTGNQIIISGKREAEQEQDVQNFYAYERSFGTFTRTFTLPQGADVENIKADLKDGVLTLAVPKKPELQPRKISVGNSNVGTTGTTTKKVNA